MQSAPNLQSRKAVAPIIATLLLAAIAVVGGIMTLGWVGGMFGSTAGTALPTPEAMQLIGYDARDVADLTSLSTLDNGQSKGGKLAAGTEYIVLKIRNAGNAEVTIEKVTIMGVDHTWHGAITAPSTTAPDAGKFQVYSRLSGNPPSVDRDRPTIAPGEDARIGIKLSSSLPDDITIGRNLIVKVKTTHWPPFNFSIPTGQAVSNTS